MPAAKKPYTRSVAAWLLAATVTSVLMSVIQSANVVNELNAIGANMALSATLGFIANDLAALGPIFFVLVAVAFAVAFKVASIAKRRHLAIFMAVGAAAIATMLLAMEPIFETTLIAGARGIGGFLSISLCGAIGGFVFHQIRYKDNHV